MCKSTSWKTKQLQYVHETNKNKKWKFSSIKDEPFEGAYLSQTIVANFTQLQPLKTTTNMHGTAQVAYKVKDHFTVNYAIVGNHMMQVSNSSDTILK